MTELRERLAQKPSAPEAPKWYESLGFTVIVTAIVVGAFAGWAIYDATSGLSPAEIESARWAQIVEAYEASPEVRAQARNEAMVDHYRTQWLAEQAAQARVEAIQEARFAAMVEWYETHWPLPQR